jgi:hypothetical protein
MTAQDKRFPFIRNLRAPIAIQLCDKDSLFPKTTFKPRRRDTVVSFANGAGAVVEWASVAALPFQIRVDALSRTPHAP